MYPVPYLRQLLSSAFAFRKKLVKSSYLLPSAALERDVMVDVYRPAVPPWRLLTLAVFNDGQDLAKMDLRRRLQEGYQNGTLKPTLVVGLHAADRMREYGTVSKKDYQGRGDRSANYERFILDELIPWVEGNFNIYHDPMKRAIGGFSLGGLNAFDLAWRNASEFGIGGVFSGALWWRHKAFQESKPDADRIIHDYVRKAKKAPKVRYWFMAGTEDEKEDRNKNGIIDAIDDTLQLMALLADKGKEEEKDFTYVEVAGGKHEPATWAEVIVDFLRWI